MQRIRIRLETLDEKAQPMTVYAATGEPLLLIQVPDVPPTPPYQAD